MPSDEQPVYRYGDFPELFWDVKPDAVIDRTNPRLIARVLTHGSIEAIRMLVPMDVLLREFETIEMPDHVRRFWSLFVDLRRNRQTRSERGQAA
jgi:hypothetical protein